MALYAARRAMESRAIAGVRPRWGLIDTRLDGYPTARHLHGSLRTRFARKDNEMRTLIAAIALLASVPAVQAGTVSIDTGSAGWTCVSGPTGCSGPAIVLGSGPFISSITLAPGWAAATGGASWIGPTADSSPSAPASRWPSAGEYVFWLQIDAGAYSSMAATIGHDDGVQVSACDSIGSACSLLYDSATPSFSGGFASFTGAIPTSAIGIQVKLTNNDFLGRTPTGFFLDASLTEVSLAVPEPQALALVVLGLAAAAAARRRRR